MQIIYLWWQSHFLVSTCKEPHLVRPRTISSENARDTFVPSASVPLVSLIKHLLLSGGPSKAQGNWLLRAESRHQVV